MIQQVKLTHRTPKGTLIRTDATIEYKDGRIFFLKSPFALKDEIKAMKGSKWHGYDGPKVWSIEDCPRNRFQLAYLTGEDVYEWFDREPIQHVFRQYEMGGKPVQPYPHQLELANSGLTYHYQLWAAEMATGKSLSAQMVIEHSKARFWYWVGPKTSLPNMRREFRKWGFTGFFGPIDERPSSGLSVCCMTYEELTRRMDEYKKGDPLPQGVVFDESSRLKGATSQRSHAAQLLADEIRAAHGFDGYVIEMSGTPAPKSPVDWWKPAEIAWPGFLREGSTKALEQRLAFLKKQEFDSGVFDRRIGWRDDERKCNKCGAYEDDPGHSVDDDDFHAYEPSENEVALMHDRMKGLVVVKHKKDCLSLPDKRYRRVVCKPSSSVLRVAEALKQAAPNAITGLTWLRELSDGFQYKDVKDGTQKCNLCQSGKIFEWVGGDRTYQDISLLPDTSHLVRTEIDCPQCGGTGQMDRMTRISREVPCPKDKALKIDLERCEETGRIVIFAGFTGSIDRVTKLCLQEGWQVVRCDGRGFDTLASEDDQIRTVGAGGDYSLEHWANMSNPRVAFVAHPESGGMSLTLVESRMAVYWSNSYKPECRVQSEDRIHRPGMDLNKGCEIVDYVHLPTDAKVLKIIRDNRRIEMMTLGEVFETPEDELDDNVVIEEIS